MNELHSLELKLLEAKHSAPHLSGSTPPTKEEVELVPGRCTAQRRRMDQMQRIPLVVFCDN